MPDGVVLRCVWQCGVSLGTQGWSRGGGGGRTRLLRFLCGQFGSCSAHPATPGTREPATPAALAGCAHAHKDSHRAARRALRNTHTVSPAARRRGAGRSWRSLHDPEHAWPRPTTGGQRRCVVVVTCGRRRGWWVATTYASGSSESSAQASNRSGSTTSDAGSTTSNPASAPTAN